MSRTLVIVLTTALVALLACGVMLYLAYGLSEGLPERGEVSGLSDSTRMVFFEDASVAIEASTREDAFSALGYLHVQHHAWSMVLWRRTALGRLGEWFGDNLLDVDRLSRKLQLGRLARLEYEELPSESRRILEAYTRGVNAALAERRVLMSDELVVLEETPERWEPWHSLAVERLFAWLATSPPNPDSLERAPLSLRDFLKADTFLRQWLHLYGFQNGVSWVLADSAGSTFYQRHVYGASALPIYQEVAMTWAGSPPLKGATLIGTPFMPAGLSETQAWSILLSSHLRLEPSERDTSHVPLLYDRILSSDGKEHLLQIEPGSSGLYFEPAKSLIAMRSDTARAAFGWVLRWSGLTSASDIAGWESLRSGSPPSFELFEGDGLLFSRGGNAAVLGDPLVTTSPGGGVFISNASWARYASERLDSLARGRGENLDPDRIRNDQRSTWAERLAPPMIDAAIGVPDQSNPVAEALAYLRNWDHSYDRASIAASVFDTWMTAYRDSLHRLPAPVLPDSMLEEHLLRYELLVRAVRTLTERHGEDISMWRWEQVQRKVYHFPVWSADSILVVDAGALPRTRYASIDVPGSGHPTTLAWGPSIVESDLLSPAEWSAWVSTNTWDSFRYHARRFPANAFFGRYLVAGRASETATVAAAGPAHTLVLVPR